MGAGQSSASAAVGKTVVTYATFQEAFQKDPGQVHDAVEAATAKVAGGDPLAQQQKVADFNTAVGALTKSAKRAMAMGTDGDTIMHTPQNDMAARLQTLLVQQATANGQVGAVQP